MAPGLRPQLAGRYPGDLTGLVVELERLCADPAAGVYPRLAHDNGRYLALLLERPLADIKTSPLERSPGAFARLALLPDLLEAGLASLEQVDRLVLPNPDLL